MRLFKLKRTVSLLLALVFSVSLIAIPAEPVNAYNISEGYVEPDVRVGIYVGSSQRFSSLNTSNSGSFEIGYAKGGFNKLFDLNQKQFIIIPQTNAQLDNNVKECVQSNNGSIGAYSAIISRHSTYQEALSVAKTVKGGFVAIVSGGFEARGFSGNSVQEVKNASSGRTVASPVANGLTVVDTSGKIIFTYEDTTRRLAVRASNGNSINIPFNKTSYSYYGYFEYMVSDGLLKMINVVPMEIYTPCVMGGEIGIDYFSEETCKAFSIMVRTFALRKKHGNDYQVCSTHCCQVYLGAYRLADVNIKYAEATKGLYCDYQGSPILALYHNSNGGASCSSLAAWGSSDLPYLKSILTQETEGAKYWNYEYTKEEFYKFLKSRSKFSGIKDSNIKMEILETDPYGSEFVTKLLVTDGEGNNVTVETAESVRIALGFDSANFDVEYVSDMTVLTSEGKVETVEVKGILTEDGYKPFTSFEDSYKTDSGDEIMPEKVKINGVGSGHGVGFSIYGSEKLARDGYSYVYILTYFFSGITVEVIK